MFFHNDIGHRLFGTMSSQQNVMGPDCMAVADTCRSCAAAAFEVSTMWSMQVFSVAWHETDRLPTIISKCSRFYAKVVVMSEVVTSRAKSWSSHAFLDCQTFENNKRHTNLMTL